MNIYKKEYQVLSSDVDPALNLKISTLFTWMQEAAIAHTIELGVTRQRSFDIGLLWVVIQYRIRFYSLPVYDDIVTLSSWPGKDMHLFFPRYFRLAGRDGRPLADASSVWGLMSEESRQIVFPEEHGIHIPQTVTGDEIPLPSRIRSHTPERTVSFTVPYSYLDLNGHMNNARYFDLASDHMSEDLRSRPVKELSADFVGEARYGDEITLGLSTEKDGFVISGEREKNIFRLSYLF